MGLSFTSIWEGDFKMINYGKSLNDKKHNVAKLCLGSGLTAAILIRTMLYILKNHYNIYFLCGNLNENKIEFISSAIIVILATAIALLFADKLLKRVLLIVLEIFILLVLAFFYDFQSKQEKYFSFKSPNNEIVLIVEENCWLLGGWSNFYIKENPMFVKKLKTYVTTDDGYRPFTNGDYEVLWLDEKSLKLTYGFGEGNKERTEIFQLE